MQRGCVGEVGCLDLRGRGRLVGFSFVGRAAENARAAAGSQDRLTRMGRTVNEHNASGMVVRQTSRARVKWSEDLL